ncbi:MAG: DUF4037 domain-containing protein [Tissierellia bacterium]|nr:DUF4037 domain-containing protein [Tissierellia bacterium]
MKGLQLSRAYYEEYGINMIRNNFPDYENRIAVGLVGFGSECYGFDDEISTDHDFGPSFCMWLTDEDYNSIGMKLAKFYEELPGIFLGYKRIETTHGKGRVGVLKISDFYKGFIGNATGIVTLNEWMFVPEHFFSMATNGEVFRDDLGEFSKIRTTLLKYYPEDVRIKKIAARAATMAQSGQYNYSRSMRRGEVVAARMALDEFIRNTISIVYLLNKKFTPFYKWMHRGMNGFTILSEIKGQLEKLACLPIQLDSWEENDPMYFQYKLNMNDKIVELIESICNSVVEELNNQNLTDKKDSFLENHTFSIMSHIKNEQIRAMHVMRG